MYDDPIVKEVQKAGQALMEEADGRVEIFFRNLKEFQKQYSDRLVRSIPKEQLRADVDSVRTEVRKRGGVRAESVDNAIKKYRNNIRRSDTTLC